MTLSPFHLSSIDVHQLLPQQEPFVMVGRMVGFSSTTTTTETEVSPRCLFVDEGTMSVEGMIENIAQTCAVRIGYIGKYIKKLPIAIGVVGAVSKLKVFGLPHVGDVLTTTITVEQEVFGITLISARVECRGVTMLTTDMKLGVQNT
jgi:predicted hotdog family 3-hydroxylacyl-ACP dehydratase